MRKTLHMLYRAVLLAFIFLIGLLLPDARVFGQPVMQPTGAQMHMLTNAQSGTAYTIQASDCGKLVSFSSSSPVAVTLPQAGSVGIVAGCWMDIQNVGPGSVTLTPVLSSIDQSPSIQLTTSQGLRLVSTGSAYLTQRGQGSGANSASGTVTNTMGSLVPGAILIGNGGSDIRTPVLAPTIDHIGNLSIPGALSTDTACSGCAGAVDLMQGTDPGAAQAANSFSLIAPPSIGSAFRWKVPAADAAGAIVSDGQATPGTLSIVPLSGTGNIAGTNSPVITTANLVQPIITSYTVATLPAGVTSGKLAFVTDGSTANDCTTGGGVNKVACMWDGSKWAFPGPKAPCISLIGYEVGEENAASPLASSDLTSHSLVINDASPKTLSEASCISDGGSQIVTVTSGTFTLFTITCVAYGSYSAGTTDGSTGYINAANMTSTAVGAHAQLNLSGIANGVTKDIKLRAYATVN